MNWDSVKTEYVTGNISYQNLADKYGCSKRAVADKGKAELWVQERQKYRISTHKESLKAAQNAEVARAVGVFTAADGALRRIQEWVTGEELTIDELCKLVSALKNISAIFMIKSPLDQREQELKIKLLEKDIEPVMDNEVTVKFVNMDW